MDAKLAAVDEARFVFVVSGGFGARQRNHFQCPSHLPAARGARRWAAPELPSGVHSHRASLACCRSSFEHKDNAGGGGGDDASDAYARTRPRLLLCTSRSVVLFTVDVILMATKMRSNTRNEKIRLALTCLHAETTSVMREAKRKRTTTTITLAEKFNGDEEVD